MKCLHVDGLVLGYRVSKYCKLQYHTSPSLEGNSDSQCFIQCLYVSRVYVGYLACWG